jgi:uncharacterized Zn finger protein
MAPISELKWLMLTLSDYATQPDTLVIEGPVRAVSTRGDIGREWWGREWVAAMEHLGLTARLQRGKRYARNGSVKRLEIGRGIAFAPVQGSRRNPYRTAIHLKPLTPDEWERALEALAEQAIYSAKLLAGEMPGDIEGVFQSAGLSLFPQSKEDIIFECSCPDRPTSRPLRNPSRQPRRLMPIWARFGKGAI